MILEQCNGPGVQSIGFHLGPKHKNRESASGFREGLTLVNHAISSHDYFVFSHG
jgi:hypothetical protein